MKGQDLGISGTKAVINTVGSKVKDSPAPIRKSSNSKKEVVPPKKVSKEQPKRPAEPVVKPPEPVVEAPKPLAPLQPVEVARPPSPPKEPVKRLITIKYSHYKDKFEAVDDYLSFPQIDEKYCISFVFKGNFVPKLKDPTSKLYANKHNQGWLLEGNEYLLEVDEDEVQESKYEKKSFKASELVEPCPAKKNQRVNDLTAELKNLTTEQLLEKGDKYKELIEQRDLQDILFK